MAARLCPKCELRFANEVELRDHIATEHPGSITPPPDSLPRSSA